MCRRDGRARWYSTIFILTKTHMGIRMFKSLVQLNRASVKSNPVIGSIDPGFGESAIAAVSHPTRYHRKYILKKEKPHSYGAFLFKEIQKNYEVVHILIASR